MAIILNYLFFNVPGHFFQIFGFLVVFAHKVCISNYLQKIPSVIVIQIKVNKKVLQNVQKIIICQKCHNRKELMLKFILFIHTRYHRGNLLFYASKLTYPVKNFANRIFKKCIIFPFRVKPENLNRKFNFNFMQIKKLGQVG